MLLNKLKDFFTWEGEKKKQRKRKRKEKSSPHQEEAKDRERGVRAVKFLFVFGVLDSGKWNIIDFGFCAWA